MNSKKNKSLNTYFKKSVIKTVTKEAQKEFEKRHDAIINAIKIKLASVEIYEPKNPEDLVGSEYFCMICLLYKFKRNNPYYNLLVTTYKHDSYKQDAKSDYFNLCYLLTKELEDKSDIKTLYRNMQAELENETKIGRVAKQMQIYKALSLSYKKEASQQNDNEALDVENLTVDSIEPIETKIDNEIIWEYIKNHCTESQLNALINYCNPENKTKLDTRTKRNIKKRLANIDFRQLF